MRRALPRVALGAVFVAVTAAALGASDAFVRDHEHGQTTLRFHRGQLHFALILDARPRVNAERDLVTAGGRRIPLEWSGRSIWIDGAKFELPFGAVFLLTTKDSTPARQLEFNAMRGRLLLDQAAAAPAVAEWLRTHGGVRDSVSRGAAQAATYPRHTLELTEWVYHGVNAVTCVVSGEPLFLLYSPAPLHGGSSTQTMFGNLATVDVQVGDAAGRRIWRATALQAVFAGRTFDFSRGRVFLIPASGDGVAQVPAALDLGPESAPRIADEIERIPEVRAFLRLE
ncbi:MAG TPA: hypothetical protein VGK89_13610 [Candidatus Eisenbacteria bacterium]